MNKKITLGRVPGTPSKMASYGLSMKVLRTLANSTVRNGYSSQILHVSHIQRLQLLMLPSRMPLVVSLLFVEIAILHQPEERRLLRKRR